MLIHVPRCLLSGVSPLNLALFGTGRQPFKYNCGWYGLVHPVRLTCNTTQFGLPMFHHISFLLVCFVSRDLSDVVQHNCSYLNAYSMN